MPLFGPPTIWKPIFNYTLTANESTLDIAGLDILSHKAYFLECHFRNVSTLNSSYRIYFNGDYTDGNYSTQYSIANGASLSAGRESRPYLGDTNTTTAAMILAHISRDPIGLIRWKTDVIRSDNATVQLHFIAASTDASAANLTSIRIASKTAGTDTASTAMISGTTIKLFSMY